MGWQTQGDSGQVQLLPRATSNVVINGRSRPTATGITTTGWGGVLPLDNRFELTLRHRHYMDDSIRVLQRLEIPNDAVLLRARRRGFSWPVNLIGFSIFAGLIFLVGVVVPSMVRDETSDGSSSPVHPTDRGLYS